MPNPYASPQVAASLPASERFAQSPRYKWSVVAMLWFICFFNYADRQAIFSVFKVLETEFGFNEEQLGWIGAAFTLVYAFSAPLAGQVVDRFSRKRIILIGLYVWSLVTGFTSICSRMWHFVLVRGAEGLGETFYFPASMSLVSDYHDRRTRSRAMGLHQTSVYAGTIGGGWLAGWMAQRYGWESPFIVLAAAGILLGAVLAWFIREPARDEAERALAGEELPKAVAAPTPWSRIPAELWGAVQDLGSVAVVLSRRPTALCLVAGFFGANFVALVFLVWMPKFLGDKFGMNLALAGFSATFYIQVASMFGATVGGAAADHFRRRSPGGRVFVQTLGLAAGAPFIFLCGWTQSLGLLIVSMTCFGFFKGMYDANIWAGLYDFVPVERRGSAVGLMNMVGWFGGGFGSIVIGRAASHGVTLSAAISSTAVIYLLVALLLALAAWVLAPRDAVHETEVGVAPH